MNLEYVRLRPKLFIHVFLILCLGIGYKLVYSYEGKFYDFCDFINIYTNYFVR